MDGGAGKGTLCKAMAEALGWHLLDSGAIYRVLALAALHHHVDVESEEALVPLAAHLDVRFISTDGNPKWCWKARMSAQRSVPVKWPIPPLRLRLSHVYVKRCCAVNAPSANCGLIADGRDMGTVVFPDAPVKIFLDASAEERAQRRLLQLQEKGFSVNFERLLSEIKSVTIAIVIVLWRRLSRPLMH